MNILSMTDRQIIDTVNKLAKEHNVVVDRLYKDKDEIEGAIHLIVSSYTGDIRRGFLRELRRHLSGYYTNDLIDSPVVECNVTCDSDMINKLVERYECKHYLVRLL